MTNIEIDTDSILQVAFFDLDKIPDRALQQYSAALRRRVRYQFITARDLASDAPVTCALLIREIDYYKIGTFSERVEQLRKSRGIPND